MAYQHTREVILHGLPLHRIVPKKTLTSITPQKMSTRMQLQLEANRIHGQLMIERDKKSTNVPLVHFNSNGLEAPSIRKVQGAYLTRHHLFRLIIV